jgi:serine/threonine-protein kinase
MSNDDDSVERRLRSIVRLTRGGGDPPRLNAGDVVAERYRIDGFVKAGGMGQVFRATQLLLDRQVALKWLLSASSQGACARFIDEARAAARIDHPNVIEVHDAGVHGGGYYLVMELLRGESLAERIRPDPDGAACPLAPRELVEIMIPVLRGLAAAHAHGVIHRDLKPDNVFLCTTSDGTPSDPKLLDFGICKLLECDHARTPTCAGAVLGTIPYMSPEQVNDAGRVDHRADIYAAGVMMYEALSGRRPFRARTAPALMFAILEQAPAPLRSLAPGVPGALEAIVQRAMAKRADQRYPTVKALIEDLSAFARAALPPASSALREPQPNELTHQATVALGPDARPIP